MLKWGPIVGPMIYMSGVHSRAEFANIIPMICMSGVRSRAELVTHALVADSEWGQVGPGNVQWRLHACAVEVHSTQLTEPMIGACVRACIWV